jgi:hypothetical protein
MTAITIVRQIDGDQVDLHGAFAGVVKGEQASLHQGFALGVIAGQDASLIAAGAYALVAGRDMTITTGGGNVVVAGGDLSIDHGAALLAVAPTVDVRNGVTGIALGGQVTLGEGSRVYMTNCQAAAMGAGFALAFGVIGLVLALLRGHRAER